MTNPSTNINRPRPRKHITDHVPREARYMKQIGHESDKSDICRYGKGPHQEAGRTAEGT